MAKCLSSTAIRFGAIAAVVAMISLAGFVQAPTASAAVNVDTCHWNPDPNYQSDQHNGIWTSGSQVKGSGYTIGRTLFQVCLDWVSGISVGVAHAEYRWVSGTPVVCDIGTNGAYQTGSGWTNAHITTCTDTGAVFTSTTSHRIWIGGVAQTSGLYYATE